MDERTFVDAHGVEVFSRWWPVDAPTGIVLIAHGGSEHSGRYDRFARALNAVGLVAVALDQRGHGRTGSSTGSGRLGPGGGQALVEDLHELRALARSRFDGATPVFMFGHSMGSLITLAYLSHHAEGLAGSVLCGFPADVDDAGTVAALFQDLADDNGRDQPVADALGDLNTAFEPARTPFDWLSRDPTEVDRYIADPLCGDDHPVTYGYVIDLFDLVASTREHLAAISCPLLVIAGDHDPAAAMGAHATRLAQSLEAAGNAAVDLVLYAGARHELLNDINRDQVTADIVTWLRSKLPSLEVPDRSAEPPSR